ncbi:MAG: RluA family pseudouridine synthase [Armatimonadetes bacterium]|nr:MAG: RluA family pseudouridine synthase [Armatimonadota bacterium]
MTRRTIEVPEGHDGDRADKTIATMLGISRRVAKSIIDSGDATIGGNPVGASDRLHTGDVVEAVMPPPEVPLEADATVEFSIAYEDPSIIVIDKPVGLVVHPGSGRTTGTLAHGLLARYPELEGVGQKDRWGIVHRLDRDTSGLMVVARTEKAYETLTEMMRSRLIKRRYLTLVRGVFTNTTGTIDAPISRNIANRTRMRVAKEGRPAITHYRRLATWDHREVSLLSVVLETGRTHQIRVHMRSIDHPIVGDPAYGRTGIAGDPGRPWLHARQLSLTHPLSGEAIDVVSPLPNDLSDSLATLGDPDHGDLADVDGEDL